MDIDSDIKQAIQLSNEILTAVNNSQFEEVSRLDQVRKALIDKYFNNVELANEELTILLKQKNDHIVVRLLEMQQQTRSQQIKLKQSQKVSKAYLSNT
ncbi:MAG: hypothetical protein GY744_14370 [Gammaproteobacteria bacterium]|nr:hypothetical protein [Gammaproteobacteria bacterium]